MNIRAVTKLLLFQAKALLTGLKSAFIPLFLTGLLIFGFVYWTQKSEEAKPLVLICNEEESFLARTVVNAILSDKISELVKFENVSYEVGRKRIENGQAILLIYIEKGTLDTLYAGEKAELNLYVGNMDNDFSKLLIDYVKGFTDIVNVAQNAGLTYMNLLYEKGRTAEERVDKFNELQSLYVKKILARNSLFEGEDRIFGFSKEDIRGAFKLISFLIALAVSLAVIINSGMLDFNMQKRLTLAGYRNLEVYLSICLIAVLVSSSTLFIMSKLGNMIGIGG